MILTDNEMDELKAKRLKHKKFIKEHGFHTCIVKRMNRLFNKQSELVLEISTVYSSYEVFAKFADKVRESIA